MDTTFKVASMLSGMSLTSQKLKGKSKKGQETEGETMRTIVMSGILVVSYTFGLGQPARLNDGGQALQTGGGSTPPLAGQGYHIPFASKGNNIELTVVNGASYRVGNVRVEAVKVPSWVHFTATDQSLAEFEKDEATAHFTFSVDKSALLNKEESISLKISTSVGESWTKEIKVSVDAP